MDKYVHRGIEMKELLPYLTGYMRFIEFEKMHDGKNSILCLSEGFFKRGSLHGYGRILNPISETCKTGFWNANQLQRKTEGSSGCGCGSNQDGP